jgi:iron complex outermembrane recepter protein
MSWTTNWCHRPVRVCIGSTLLLCLALSALGQRTDPPANIYDASLDELMNVRVTSASKKEQSISKVAAAIFVITPDDIRRSGATNIPDLLRMVPGVDVAQINAHTWAISARGFNGRFANKLLVLVDGRSVYSLTYSGVFWDQLDVPLADIDRIEVIRGPGATVWGANAVNGVINIITKSSKETQGGLVEAAGGTSLAAQGLVQYGATAGSSGHYRVFGSTSDYRANTTAQGGSGQDPWHLFHGGFRSDWQLSSRDSLTVQGDLFSDIEHQTYASFASLQTLNLAQFDELDESHGGNMLGRWTRKLSLRSDFSLQMYFDRNRTQLYGGRYNVDTLDFDFQHHLELGGRHDIVWGLGYRSIPGTSLPGYAGEFLPPNHTNFLASGFLQDEISLGKSFWLTVGTKYEYNDYNGSGFEPSIRALWSPNARHSVWAAVSGALRDPSREDESIKLYLGSSAPSPATAGLTALFTFLGNSSIRAERLTAYESGYRYELNKWLSLDLATFYDQYRRLIAVDSSAPYLSLDPMPLHLVVPSTPENKLNGNVYGAEVSANINISSHWKLSPDYSWLRMNLHQEPGSNDPNPQIIQGDGPEHQFGIRSYLSLPERFTFDTSLAFVGALADQKVPSYNRLDARLARTFGESLELSVVGQNLLDNRHLEFNANDASMATWIKRSLYAKISFRF